VQTVEVVVAEAEEAVAAKEGVDEAATAEVMHPSPRAAVAMPDSPEVVAVVTGPEPVVVPEVEVAARVGNSARFYGSREISPESSNPYR
jgi:hypothetical protein